MREQLYITHHAIKRFRERIEPSIADPGAIVMEMLRCLATARPKHFTRKNLCRKTYYIPTDRCLMIVSWGRIMTVIERKDRPPKHYIEATEMVSQSG